MTQPSAPDNDAIRAILKVRPPQEAYNWLNFLPYGEVGAGKTHLLGTAADDPRTSPVLAVDVEGGFTTLRNKSDIDTVTVRSRTEMISLYNELFKSIDPATNTLYYKTIGVDSGTELADLYMKEIMAAYGAVNQNIDTDVPDQRAYGKSRSQMRNLVRALRDLPCNTIFVCAMGTAQEEGQPSKVFPKFSGQLRTEIPGFMDIVGYLAADVRTGESEVRRTLQLQGTKRVVAKDRTGALGSLVENPTIPLLWDLIHSSTDIKTD